MLLVVLQPLEYYQCPYYSLVGEEQIGFRKGRPTSDAVFVLRQIMEKHREFDKQTHVAFLDFVKAFDNVRRPLWSV